jgi:hypothetical protein
LSSTFIPASWSYTKVPAETFIPLLPEDRERDLANLFREVEFDVDKFLAAIVGYGRLHVGPSLPAALNCSEGSARLHFRPTRSPKSARIGD